MRGKEEVLSRGKTKNASHRLRKPRRVKQKLTEDEVEEEEAGGEEEEEEAGEEEAGGWPSPSPPPPLRFPAAAAASPQQQGTKRKGNGNGSPVLSKTPKGSPLPPKGSPTYQRGSPTGFVYRQRARPRRHSLKFKRSRKNSTFRK